MTKFDFILSGQIPLDEIKESLKFGTDRDYRVDKFIRTARAELMTANSDYDFATVYQRILEAIHRNGFESLHPYIEKMRSQASEDRLRLDNLLIIKSHTVPNKKNSISDWLPDVVWGKDIAKNIMANWYWYLCCLLASWVTWKGVKGVLISLFIAVKHFFI